MTRDDRDNMLRNIVKSNLIMWSQSTQENLESSIDEFCKDIFDILDNFESTGSEEDVTGN